MPRIVRKEMAFDRHCGIHNVDDHPNAFSIQVSFVISDCNLQVTKLLTIVIDPEHSPPSSEERTKIE